MHPALAVSSVAPSSTRSNLVMNTMLKTLSSSALAVAALALAQPVLAQSSVTIYGVLDLYLQNAKGDARTSSLQSGGLQGSRLGFRGTEDLGGGTSAVFLMEHGIAADTGTVTQGGVFWGRQIYAGLSNKDAGTLTLGRQYSPHFFAADANDIFGTGAGSGFASGVLTTVFRIDNSATYASPKLGGVVDAMLTGGLGEGSPRSVSGHLRYAEGPLSVSLTGLQRDTAEKFRILGLGANYNFGSFKLVAGFQTVKNSSGVLGAKDDKREFWGQVQVPVGNDQINAGFADSKVKGVIGKHARQLSLSYVHNLSKRTSVYGVLSQIDNDTATSFTTSSATGAGPVTSAGHDASGLQLGLRHRF